MARSVFRGAALAILASTTLLSGCGSQATGPGSGDSVEDRFAVNALYEVAELMRFRETEAKQPAASAADFAKYEKGLPIGYKQIQDGNIVVVWGAKVDESASDKVIAYEKKAPESGGYVLMADGKTVKKMTADEFKAAPKAAGSS